MAIATKICKVCGKEYEYCHTNRNVQFRYQDVACCPEHGSIYFARVLESREEKPLEKSKKSPEVKDDASLRKTSKTTKSETKDKLK